MVDGSGHTTSVLLVHFRSYSELRRCVRTYAVDRQMANLRSVIPIVDAGDYLDALVLAMWEWCLRPHVASISARKPTTVIWNMAKSNLNVPLLLLTLRIAAVRKPERAKNRWEQKQSVCLRDDSPLSFGWSDRRPGRGRRYRTSHLDILE